jgi:hypothetical protein
MKGLSIFALAAFAAPLSAQDAAPLAPQAAGEEEVIVRGHTPLELRLEIERVENTVYARFNALNSTDDFDILCSENAPTGSNIRVRTCKPNFVLRAEQRGAGSSLDRMQGGRYASPQNVSAHLQQQSEALTAEMQRIAREDEELMRGLMRLAQLKEMQSVDGQPPPREPESAPAGE